MRMMTRIKTTAPPPMYIAHIPFPAGLRILDEWLVVWAVFLLDARLRTTYSSATSRYLESSWRELAFPLESTT
jgi:hypothetical protein